jgi:hypothetical protein
LGGEKEKTPSRTRPSQRLTNANTAGAVGIWQAARRAGAALGRFPTVTGVLMFLKPPMCDMVAETVSASFHEHKAIQELTHCTTGICVLGEVRRNKAECGKAGQSHPKPPQSHINATSKPPQSVLIAKR